MATSTSIETTEQSFNRVASDEIMTQMEAGGLLEPNSQYYTPDTEGGPQIDVDDSFSDTSTNPVENRVITSKINMLSQQIGFLESDIEGVNTNFSKYLPKTGGTVTGTLTVNSTLTASQSLKIGSITITYDSTSRCLKFTF